MKKFLAGSLSLFVAVASIAQQKEGKVTYQRSSQVQISFNNGGGGEAPPMQQTRVDHFELNFANQQMSWQQLPENVQEEASNAATGGESGSFVFRTIGGGSDDKVFCDFAKARKVEGREFFDKKFLISDSIRRGNWKLSDETKTILGHLCRKATSERIGKRMMMQMENGKMERKEIDDTSAIIAWFTMDIPVPAGPDMQGQLPGLILELIVNNGRVVFQAVEITPKPDLSAIKEPTKGKKVTPEEFTKERNKMLEEMQRNNGGSIQMRMN